MKCPKCDMLLKASMDKCPRCGLPLIQTDKAELSRPLPMRVVIVRSLLVVFGMLITACLFAYAGVRIHYWREAQRVEREYVNHTIERIKLDNGMTGHALTFFGEDGDTLYIEELRESFMYVGGTARVEFADYVWFDADPSDVESALITLSPILIKPSGDKTKLPKFAIQVPVPEAPVTVTAPAESRVEVITSLASVNMNVVYGSQVIINGEDVTDKVDRSGALALNVNVYPIGDNNISVIVRTDHHKEARRDIVFYRDEMEINLELATSVGFKSTLNYMTITGKTDPGAWIEVDTDYDSSSLVIDQETGIFSFKAKFSAFGDNPVSFRATMPGKRDSEITFNVSYLPAKAEYSRNAWAMDYAQLRLIYEQWRGRVFLCVGTIVDVYYEGDTQFSVMDVSKEGEPQLVVLENQSDIGSLNVGGKYSVHADVAGRLFYDTGYCPYLIARYASVVTE